MLTRVSSPKDFWTGLIYVALGAAALWLGRDYTFGSAARMGPGYFPLVLSGILVVLGLVSLARSFIAKGEPVGAIFWKPLVLVLIGCAVFGLLLNPLGLPIALLTLCRVLTGIGPVTTIAMLLPATFGLPPVSALIMLAGGEAVHAEVVLRNGAVVSEADLITHVRGKLGSHKPPKSIAFVPQLPLSAAGKIMRRLVKEKYWKDQTRGVA